MEKEPVMSNAILTKCLRENPPTTPAADEAAKCNFLWASRIGDRVVGLLHLVGIDNQTVSIALFRVDPEYRHTTVLTNLIQYAHTFCRDRGCKTVLLESHVAPLVVLRQLEHHGFRLVCRKLVFGQDVLEFRVEPDWTPASETRNNTSLFAARPPRSREKSPVLPKRPRHSSQLAVSH
jgi:hypothetical protein